MARIELRRVAHSYGRNGSFALRPLDLVWEDGGAYALLGPSGCGKTTMLNIISGLLRPSEGKVLIDGRDVTEAEPRDRNIAQVFQFPVIYDTMTVFDNLAFPLRNRGIAEVEVCARVEEIAAMLDLGGDLRRRAAGLTADAKQKISLGRGLVRTDVAAVLFDEPLTVINPHMKFLLRRKLKQVHERLGITFIYVTHDQNEALTFAQQVVVMHEGAVVQMGSPQDLFERPAHTFVGYFIGSPGMNLVPCRLEGDTAVINGSRIPLTPGVGVKAAARGGAVRLGVRPEFLRLAGAGEDGIAMRIATIEDLGNYSVVTVKLDEHVLRIKVPEGEAVGGETCRIVFPPEHTKVYADEQLVE